MELLIMVIIVIPVCGLDNVMTSFDKGLFAKALLTIQF